MAGTAALIASQVIMSSEADRKAKKRIKKEEEKVAVERKRIAESTPFGSKKAENRAGAERELLRRRLASGRSSTILQKSDTVG